MRVFMPYVLAFNRKAIEAEDRAARRLISASTAASTASSTPCSRLRAADRRPAHAAGLKVDGSKAETIVEMAIVDPTAGGNPVPLTKEGSRKLFEAALSGNLAAAA